MTDDTSLADRLLDAQVEWVLDELTGDRLQQVIARDVDTLLDVAADVRMDALVDPDDVLRVLRRLLATVPASVTASTMVEATADVVHEGPPGPVAASQVVQRDHVEALVDEVLALHPVAARALDQLAESPLVATVATRFVSRIVVDVLQANRQVAERIPGMGSIFSLGTSAASKVMGAAERPLQLVGDTAGKGATIAVRRLNAVVIDTLQDPLLRDAIMQVWDQHADDPVPPPARALTRDDLGRIAGLLQEVVIAGATSEPVDAVITALVTRFFDIYGEHPVTTLLEELEITRDDIVGDLQAVLPRVVEAARADGRLEQAIRARLEPFFRSPVARALLTTS